MAPRKKEKPPANTLEELLDKHKDSLNRGSNEIFSYSRIPFYIPALDELIGGGIPRKRITILSGQPNTGKSYLTSQAVVSVQKNGGTAAWIDTEISWDPEWMAKCGIDTDNILLAQPTAGEDAFNLIRDLMNDGVDLVVLDSIAGVVPSSLATDEDFNFNPMAWQARFVNQSLPRIMPSLKYGSAFVAINQLRSSIGNVDFLDSMPGGKAQSFFAHLVLQVRRSGWIREKINGVDERVGFDIEIRNRKSKAGGHHQRACTIPFRFDAGFDIVETFIRESIKHNITQQSGMWYKLFNDEKIQGMNGVKAYFLDNPEKFDTLVSMVNNKEVEKEDDDVIEEVVT